MDTGFRAIKFKLVNERAKAPYKKHDTDSGFDLATVRAEAFGPFETKLIDLGVAFELPKGTELILRPRSSLSKAGYLGAIGTIDEGYTGEVKAIITNLSMHMRKIEAGRRIMQAVPCATVRAEVFEALEFDNESERGANGFGSTGQL